MAQAVMKDHTKENPVLPLLWSLMVNNCLYWIILLFLVITIYDINLENEYSAMNGQLSILLTHIADEIFENKSLEVIKKYLVGIKPSSNERIKEIKEVNDGVDLINLLRHQYSLSNVIHLRDLVQNCKCKTKDIMTELDGLVERRDKFYGVLAKEFAKKAIEDHGKTNTESTVSY